jgi:alcohol dehydrogenase class IV
MLLASLQAGLAFSNASLGAVHALAHSLGGYLDLPHGECNALLLEHVTRFNMTSAVERFRKVGEAIGIDPRGMGEQELSRRITEALSSLRRRVGIVDALAARGVSESDIPQLTRHAINDACLVTNPRRVVVGDVRAIYGEAL